MYTKVVFLFCRFVFPLTPSPSDCPSRSPKRRGEENLKNFVIPPLLSGEGGAGQVYRNPGARNFTRIVFEV